VCADWTLQNQLCAVLHAILAAQFPAVWEVYTREASALMLPHCATNVMTVRLRSLTTLRCISGKSHLIVTMCAQRCNATHRDASVHECAGGQCTDAHKAGCTYTQMHTRQDAQMHRCTLGRMHKRTAGRMHKWTDAHVESRQDALMGRRTNGKQAGCTDGQMHKWKAGRMR